MEFSQTIVAKIEGRDVTQGELAAAFNWVANEKNWKLPIDVQISMSARQTELVRVAVPFFTGGEATIIVLANGIVHVVAAGYYASVGA